MRKTGLIFFLSTIIAILSLLSFQASFVHGPKSRTYSAHNGKAIPFNQAAPVEMMVAPGGNNLLIISEEPAKVIEFSTVNQTLRNLVDLTQKPTGAVLSSASQRLFVTLGGPVGRVAEIDIRNQKVIHKFTTDGHTPVAPTLSHDEQTLYVCNRFNNEVVVIDLKKNKVVNRFQVVREPNSMLVSKDGNFLFVGNFIPSGPSDVNRVNSEISVIDLQKDFVKNIQLPNGSHSVKALAISPDGKYVYATHILSRFQLPTTQIERGWINTNALSIIDAGTRELVSSVLLDDVDLGFSNPFAISCSPDGELLLVTSFGGNELSVIDRNELHRRIKSSNLPKGQKDIYSYDLANDLSFMHRVNRKRIKLPGYGPNSIIFSDNGVYIAEYFSGTLSLLDLDKANEESLQQFSLGEKEETVNTVRYGQMLFNSSDLCFQKWQSCTSCHPDVRVDGLNWDLLNDGIGNPKNTKSLLYSHITPPSMAMGVRATAEDAVRAGMRFIQFAEVDEEKASAIDIYLKSLRPEPSPYLINNSLTKSARRGKKIFEREGCSICHPQPMYTDLKKYKLEYVGSNIDKGKQFENPTLVEAWRTAPYLHDGSAKTIDELIRIHNPYGTGKLTEKELSNITEYVLSL